MYTHAVFVFFFVFVVVFAFVVVVVVVAFFVFDLQKVKGNAVRAFLNVNTQHFTVGVVRGPTTERHHNERKETMSKSRRMLEKECRTVKPRMQLKIFTRS